MRLKPMNLTMKNIKPLFAAAVTAVSATAALSVQANDPGYYGTPPQNRYWQAPDWSGYGRPPAPPAYTPPPAYAPAPPAYAPPPVYNNYQAPPHNAYGRAYPPPQGPYGYMPDNGASAFYTPGYNRYRYGRGGWNKNKFWGRSGPSRWMNPSKDNLEQGWDDMINAPSRMGKMPGGWYAPEVTMPNPIDMGDQIQDNMKDLPEQIKDMNVGNEVE